MQIVINISEETKRAIDMGTVNLALTANVWTAIRNGTPLPRRHKRLIEDNFEVGPVFDEEGCLVAYRYVTQEDLNNAMTIIEADKEGSEEE